MNVLQNTSSLREMVQAYWIYILAIIAILYTVFYTKPRNIMKRLSQRGGWGEVTHPPPPVPSSRR